MSKSIIRKALSSKGYLQVNKHLAKTLGMHAALMLAELVFQSEIKSADKDGYFSVYRVEMEKETTLSRKLQRAGEKMLEAHKLLKTKTNSVGNQVFYKLNDAGIEKFFED